MKYTTMRNAAVLLALLGGLSCAEQTNPAAQKNATPKSVETAETKQPTKAFQTATLPDDHHLASLKLPLFSPDAEKRYAELRKERRAQGKPETVLTDTIAFAQSLDEAFARATKEDKPVLLITQVRENGDLECDV